MKILLVASSSGFRDEEYFVPKEIFEKEGFLVKTASDKKGGILGDDGGEAISDFLVQEVDPFDFEAIVFIGGPNALTCLDNESSYDLIRKAKACNRILGFICISPVIAAKAGVLEGIRATAWSSPLDKSGIKELENHQAKYQEREVVSDQNIVTANGPKASEKFARAVIALIDR